MFKYIEPEVAGGLGEKTQMDSSVHPPIVSKLHFVFEDWLGDDIIETFPCYIVTESLKDEISKRNLTGITFDDVLVTKSPNFNEINPGKQLPQFLWAKINGRIAEDDFSIANDNRLLVSDRAYNLLKEFNISNALLEEMS